MTAILNTQKQNSTTRMHSTIKRPRAPIACYRCHHKKVRCDGVHPNCTRCLSTGVLCAYPSSRRSRNTQPTNIDPFIDNLSQLETRIRQIETDLESLKGSIAHQSINDTFACQILKTETDLQESRSIVAQLRLKGEQRAARVRRSNRDKSGSSTQSPSPTYPFYFTQDFIPPCFPPSTSPYPQAISGWPLIQTTDLVDPMIIAAALEAQQHRQTDFSDQKRQDTLFDIPPSQFDYGQSFYIPQL
ncbi:hypothetical protein A0J61_05830 [Choanephora cucurbitarum]|uniref:Zn(2)-C6 fungal-type domain-containing protein n=1 Tax=Choanephora cucurbitarum TaxID=101091 RepID=A0A1C7NBH8_9FUNG|nr:hypothetical protein A0J61_05830 [Choanephora cucurbitarum]